MYILQASQDFNWKEFLMGSEDWSVLPETMLRTFIMFLVILTSLRLLGKRGVRQLSVFELVVIIGLGSAAGDPMFYKDVGILPALIVFSMVVSLYSLVMTIIGKSKKFENLVEGKPVCLIRDGVFSIVNFKKEVLSEDEFFAELRMQGVSQLGQIEQAIVETSGNISLFFYENDQVKYGLPIMPESLNESTQIISSRNSYSCTFCGFTSVLEPAQKHVCPSCKRVNWIKSSNKLRIR